ncbi:MAG: alpha/beta fold hydrolase, partial [Chloroflexi bacterium]|nr:alpha/beta fold hydrolase [Chloroflexota bacterium]
MSGYPLLRGAEPFHFQGTHIGCLLIHGFTGSPWEMRWLGEQLAADGHSVRGIRLAGHGTCPEDMRSTRWHDWYATVLDGYRELRAQCEQVVVIGLSLGGALALHLAAHETVDALVVMATPLHIRDWRLTAFRPFQRFIPYWRMSDVELQDEAARDASIGYDRMPTICLVSMLDFFKQVER